MTSAKLFVILAVMALALTLPTVVTAQQVPPHLSLIDAWIDGEAAPDGTVVTAMMEGKDDVTATITNGQAVLVIEGVPGDTGATITFKIGDLTAAETDTWEQGGHADASLTISASSVPVEAGRVVTITLSELNDSGQSGTATLTEFGDNTEVVLSLSAGALQTELVHIHLGQCGDDLGAVDIPLTSFVDGSGNSTSMIDVSLDSLLDGEHAINSHEAGNPGNYTACGNIPPTTPEEVVTVGVEGPEGSGGPRGRKGAKGDTGSAGGAGADGDQGAAGADGTAGSVGAKGPAGSAGGPGPAGPAGVTGGAGTVGGDGSSNVLGIVGLILAIVALVAVGGAFLLGRKA